MTRTQREILDDRIAACRCARDEPESEPSFRCICDDRIAELEAEKAQLPDQRR